MKPSELSMIKAYAENCVVESCIDVTREYCETGKHYAFYIQHPCTISGIPPIDFLE